MSAQKKRIVLIDPVEAVEWWMDWYGRNCDLFIAGSVILNRVGKKVVATPPVKDWTENHWYDFNSELNNIVPVPGSITCSSCSIWKAFTAWVELKDGSLRDQA